jgi:hypothetical protein
VAPLRQLERLELRRDRQIRGRDARDLRHVVRLPREG